MKEKRSLFNMVFGNKVQKIVGSYLQMMTGYRPVFSGQDSTIENSIDAIKCINSWKKYCPDYEIIEWNEDNYDINKNKFMRQAYEAKKWVVG